MKTPFEITQKYLNELMMIGIAEDMTIEFSQHGFERFVFDELALRRADQITFNPHELSEFTVYTQSGKLTIRKKADND